MLNWGARVMPRGGVRFRTWAPAAGSLAVKLESGAGRLVPMARHEDDVFEVTVPEIGTFKANRIPLVFLTSNDAREMSDALKRRCLHLWIDYPDPELEVAILDSKVPGIDERLAQDVVELMNNIRALDVKKPPSISETLDWARALLALNADELDEEIVSSTLNVILKYEGDVKKAQGELGKLITQKSAKIAAEGPQTEEAPKSDKGAAKKGVLH